MKFVFLRPDVYRSLPSASASPWTPIETPSAEGDTFFSPYKGRNVQLGSMVDVYRNLHTDNGYSIRCSKSGLVLAHCSTVHLKDAKFHISESGRQKTIEEKRKRVHAYVRGILVQYNVDIPSYFQEVRYNPYLHSQFTHTDGGIVKETPEVICSGKHVYVSPGIRPFYTDDEVRGSLQLLGYDLNDEENVSELAINEGYKWDEIKGLWY